MCKHDWKSLVLAVYILLITFGTPKLKYCIVASALK